MTDPEFRAFLDHWAFSVAMVTGWLALVIGLAWKDLHCKCCSKKGGRL